MKSDKGWWNRHLGGTPAPTQQQPQHIGHPPPPPAQNYQQHPQVHTQQQAAQPQVTIENFTTMMEYWQGGEATRTETSRCPKCGGNHYFSRSQGAHRGPAPAPMCADCGFNGLFDQGDPTNWNS
jgi:hypothetical protein